MYVCACVCAHAPMFGIEEVVLMKMRKKKKVTEHPSEVSVTQVGVPDEGMHQLRDV